MTPARWWQRNSQRVALGSMLLPYLIGLSLLVIGPGLAGFALSLTDYNAIQPPTWAGLENFRRLPDDHIFRIAVFNSLLYIVLAVPIRLVGALLLARLLQRPSRSSLDWTRDRLSPDGDSRSRLGTDLALDSESDLRTAESAPGAGWASTDQPGWSIRTPRVSASC